jgi:mannose-6-phosphate isomerase-like protein (cupin superfamily)
MKKNFKNQAATAEELFRALFEEIKEKDTKPPKSTGFHVDMEKVTVDNKSYRKILFTGKHLQLGLMSIEPGEDVGIETHPETDQFFRVDGGSGEASIGGKKYALKDGDAIIIPAGSEHNITAGEEGIKLYTIYAPPHHSDKVIHKSKEDAEADESDKPPVFEAKCKKEDIINFFKENPNPSDDQLHKWAEEKGFNIHRVEEIVYKLATDHVKMMED